MARATRGAVRRARLGHLGMKRTDRMMARCHPRTLTITLIPPRRIHVGVYRRIRRRPAQQMSVPLQSE
eukprot:3484147-Prymnesium_polylepis.2